MNTCNKLEYFSQATLSCIVYCLQVRLEPTQVKPLLGAPVLSKLLGAFSQHFIFFVTYELA